MKTNSEIRREAKALLKTAWFWRIVLVGVVLYSIALFVNVAFYQAYGAMEVQTWTDFLQAKFKAAQGGLGCSVPSASLGWSMTGATLFRQFAEFLFGAICLFGIATVLLKAVRDDDDRWFAGSFGGFARPFSVTWLVVLMNFRIFLWSLLLVVPGLIAVYRYRQAWYLKSEHPDWGAGRCLAESGRLMKGFKWQAFCLDCFFLGWLLLVTVLVAGVYAFAATGSAGLNGVFGAFLSTVAGFGVTWLVCYVAVYVLLARAFFYRALKASALPAEPCPDGQ